MHLNKETIIFDRRMPGMEDKQEFSLTRIRNKDRLIVILALRQVA